MKTYEFIIDAAGRVVINPASANEKRKVRFADIDGRLQYYGRKLPPRWLDTVRLAVVRHALDRGVRPSRMRYFR